MSSATPAGGQSSLIFPGPRLEEVYLVYTAEKNRGLTLRLHTMLIAAWAAGALKTVGQAMQAYQLGEGKLLPQFVLLLLVQLVNLVCQAYSMRRFRSLARQEQLLQEQSKAWLHILSDVAVMVCVMLSDPALPHAPAPVPTLVATSLLAVLDVVRLDTLLRLHAVKWLCFLLLEVDHFVQAPGHGIRRVGVDLLRGVVFGTLLPFGLAAVSEATQRATFLRDCKRPMTALGPFWGRVNLVVRRFQRQPVAEEEEAHND